jgi:hypothetical protein
MSIVLRSLIPRFGSSNQPRKLASSIAPTDRASNSASFAAPSKYFRPAQFRHLPAAIANPRIVLDDVNHELLVSSTLRRLPLASPMTKVNQPALVARLASSATAFNDS